MGIFQLEPAAVELWNHEADLVELQKPHFTVVYQIQEYSLRPFAHQSGLGFEVFTSLTRGSSSDNGPGKISNPLCIITDGLNSHGTVCTPCLSVTSMCSTSSS
jgi:hypothetical protein